MIVVILWDASVFIRQILSANEKKWTAGIFIINDGQCVDRRLGKDGFDNFAMHVRQSKPTALMFKR